MLVKNIQKILKMLKKLLTNAKMYANMKLNLREVIKNK